MTGGTDERFDGGGCTSSCDSLDSLRRFESLGARHLGKWHVQTTYHKRIAQQTHASDKIASEMILVHFTTDTPDKVDMRVVGAVREGC